MIDDDPDTFSEADARPSKTAQKKAMLALQRLGEELVALSPRELAAVPMPPELADAVQEARRIKSREGKRRQLQYIGRVMRGIDPTAIEQALDDLKQGQRALAQRFHQLEQLRDELLAAGPEGTDRAMERYPTADRQHLRQLLRQAQREQAQDKPPAAARKLFRYLRELEEGSRLDSGLRGGCTRPMSDAGCRMSDA